MWQTIDFYSPPPRLWKTRVIQANSALDLDVNVQRFVKTLDDKSSIQSIQYGGCAKGLYSAMVVYFISEE